MINVTTISRPYAKAILALAQQKGTESKWTEILEFLDLVVTDRRVQLFLSNLAIAHEIKAKFLCELAPPELNQQTQNLIKILAKNKRLLLLPEIYKVYEGLRQQAQQQLTLTLTTADPLEQRAIDELSGIFAADFAEQIILAHKIDPKLIAGGKLKIGDRVVNSSVKNRLRTLYNHLIR